MSNAKVRARRRRRAQNRNRKLSVIVQELLQQLVDARPDRNWYTNTEGARRGHHYLIFGDRP